MNNDSPDLPQPQVEAESVTIWTPEFAEVLSRYNQGHLRESELIDALNSIITARVAAARQAGFLAALHEAAGACLRAAPDKASASHYADCASAVLGVVPALAASQAAPAVTDPVRDLLLMILTEHEYSHDADGVVHCYECGATTNTESTVHTADEHEPGCVLWLAREWLAGQAAPAKVEGWKTVPTKPSEEMMIVGARSIIDGQDSRPGTSWAEEAGLAYEAMIAAAPSTPAKEPT